MKNQSIDLHNHLFAQLERLSDESLKGEELEREIARSGAVTAVSREIIANASLVLKAERLKAEGLVKKKNTIPGLSHDSSKA